MDLLCIEQKFSTWDEFIMWKESEKESSNTCFVQPKGEEVSKNGLETSKIYHLAIAIN